MFYKPQAEAVKFKPKYEKLANNIDGLVRLGAVDCVEHASFCSKVSGTKFPAFMTIHKGNRVPYNTELKKGSLKSLKSFALDALPGSLLENVATLGQVEDWIKKARGKSASWGKAALFFQPGPPPLFFRSVAARFYGDLSFATVDTNKMKSKELLSVARIFGANRWPALCIVDTLMKEQPKCYKSSILKSKDEVGIREWLESKIAPDTWLEAKKDEARAKEKKKKDKEKGRGQTKRSLAGVVAIAVVICEFSSLQFC